LPCKPSTNNNITYLTKSFYITLTIPDLLSLFSTDISMTFINFLLITFTSYSYFYYVLTVISITFHWHLEQFSVKVCSEKKVKLTQHLFFKLKHPYIFHNINQVLLVYYSALNSYLNSFQMYYFFTFNIFSFESFLITWKLVLWEV